ncbi:hypothetical protein IWQ60_009033 [Tieghemiomyces parasiticus]|uniref:Large-conductance mechanosensitive channel n=1 Tax=Tieghemiomyces parasiticus TaxID=78921 RepID=A0A9W7ZPJ7_9FUNG|nr:hypothetical protein IWQ60_009033 [Tieghemiomyces parasiticus]
MSSSQAAHESQPLTGSHRHGKLPEFLHVDVHGVRSRLAHSVGSLWDEFKEFIDKGNVVDLAIGIILGSAFSKVVSSFVEDILLPPLGLLIGSNFENRFAVLRYGNGNTLSDGEPATQFWPGRSDESDSSLPEYNTIEQAQSDGAITLNYGRFIQYSVNFLIVGAALYVMVRFVLMFRQQQKAEPKNLCPYCYQPVHIKAKRCPCCTSALTKDPLTDSRSHYGAVDGQHSPVPSHGGPTYAEVAAEGTTAESGH